MRFGNMISEFSIAGENFATLFAHFGRQPFDLMNCSPMGPVFFDLPEGPVAYKTKRSRTMLAKLMARKLFGFVKIAFAFFTVVLGS
jgi:hypothetical protein